MDLQKTYDFIVVGGGASGFFSAINIAEKGYKVLILEKYQKVLSKLAVSGGGRCNVTHHEFDPKKLVQNYPRGLKALLGPLHKFGPENMIQWLKNAGVDLKKEADGRMFPVTDSSSTIIECFQKKAADLGVEILKGYDVQDIILGENICEVICDKGHFFSKNMAVCSGSNRHIWDILSRLGHTIIEPVASLFALNTPHSLFNELSGLSLQDVIISFKKHKIEGPLLFTHFGLSGPAALKLSSFGALEFNKEGYKGEITLDLLPKTSFQDLEMFFKEETKTLNQIHLGLPKRLWELLILNLKLDKHKPLNHISKADKSKLISALKQSKVILDGKTTHKEEFVTAGGIDLNEVCFSSMRSKIFPHLYFAGEVLNIDGVTGGFNFQSAWTTSYLIAASLP
jgi:predicted Rossmann fold flavoprotein